MSQKVRNQISPDVSAAPWILLEKTPQFGNGKKDLIAQTVLTVDLDGETLTDAQFQQIERDYPQWKIELNGTGELIFMPSTGWIPGTKNNTLSFLVTQWARQDGTGEVGDSSTMFVLPNGARRSPDVSWVLRERLAKLTTKQLQGYLPLAPDFVIELRSPTDSLKVLQEKMNEYIENGVRLGWLIDPKTQKVHVHRQGHAVEILENPSTLNGENVLLNFTLDLSEIF